MRELADREGVALDKADPLPPTSGGRYLGLRRV